MVALVEARWFVRGPIPADAAAWFTGLGPDAPEEARTDRYLAPVSPDEPGVKLRAGNVEVKQRTRVLGEASLGTLRGSVEAWKKWGFTLAPLPADDAGWVPVAKRRRVQSFSIEGGHIVAGKRANPSERASVAVELAEVRVGEEVWWSVCLEATGPDDETRLAAFHAVARHVFGPGAPPLAAADSMGYPAFLFLVRGER